MSDRFEIPFSERGSEVLGKEKMSCGKVRAGEGLQLQSARLKLQGRLPLMLS